MAWKIRETIRQQSRFVLKVLCAHEEEEHYLKQNGYFQLNTLKFNDVVPLFDTFFSSKEKEEGGKIIINVEG